MLLDIIVRRYLPAEFSVGKLIKERGEWIVKKYVLVVVFSLLSAVCMSTGCNSNPNPIKDKKESVTNNDIVSATNVPERDNGASAVDTLDFPKHFEADYSKLHFNTDIVVEEGADINNLYRFSGKRATYDMQKAYEKLTSNVHFEKTYEGEGIGEEGVPIPNMAYEGTNKEKMFLNGETLTFLTPWSNYILRCVHPDSRDPRYNMDKYALNGEFEFMNKENGYEQILLLLNDIGFKPEIDFQTVTYALNYSMLEQEEYNINMDGIEDTSKYKESWSEEDNCYYYFIRQKVNGLPLYYVYGNVIKELDICNSPVQVLYSKNGIQRLDIDKLFEIDDTADQKLVSPLPLEDLTQLMENQYEMLISDATFDVYKMELYMMAQKNLQNTYDFFPVWIISMEQIQTENGQSVKTPMQAIIDVETGTIIS